MVKIAVDTNEEAAYTKKMLLIAASALETQSGLSMEKYKEAQNAARELRYLARDMVFRPVDCMNRCCSTAKRCEEQ